MNINRFDTLLGYEKTLMPMRVSRTAETLAKCLRYKFLDDTRRETGTEILTEAEFIAHALQEGRKPESYIEKRCGKCSISHCSGDDACVKRKAKYHMTGEKYGTSISKTGYRFALWLIAEGLTTFEAVQTRIDEEAAEKEKAAQEAMISNQRKIEEKKIEEQAEREYEEWLNEATRNYGGVNTLERTKVLIQRGIFMDLIGEYFDYARNLLVLIDNIDNPRCRMDIIDRLHNSNVASIKTFEHITGIKLAKTYKERQAQLKEITKADYAAQPKQYKPCRAAEHKEYNTTYYICKMNPETKKPEFVEAQGCLWRYSGYDFYIRKDKKGLYEATEGKTGIKVTGGHPTLTALYKGVKDVMASRGEGFGKIIELNIERNGLSPLYNRC